MIIDNPALEVQEQIWNVMLCDIDIQLVSFPPLRMHEPSTEIPPSEPTLSTAEHLITSEDEFDADG